MRGDKRCDGFDTGTYHGSDTRRSRTREREAGLQRCVTVRTG
jgi:hypothetical protein